MLSDGEVTAESSGLSTAVVYKLLTNEAEFLLLGRLKELGYPEQKAVMRQNMLNQQTVAILDALKKAPA